MDNDAAQSQVDDLRRRIAGGESMVLSGLPGSGKSTLLLDAFRAIRDADEGTALILTPDRRRAEVLERMASEQLLAAGDSALGPRAIQSTMAYARRIISAWLVQRISPIPVPTFVDGADEDLWFAAYLEENSAEWARFIPEGALGSRALRMDLRNIVARAGERGIGPSDVSRIGSAAGEPLWQLVSKAYEAYAGGDDVAFTPESPHVDSARMPVIAARLLQRWDGDREAQGVLCPAPTPDFVLVDDLQDCTPATAVLLEALASGGTVIVAASNSSSATKEFRGGQPDLGTQLARRLGLDVFGLKGQRRLQPPVQHAVETVQSWLDGTPRTPAPTKQISLAVSPGPGRLGTLLADSIRQSHYHSTGNPEVPWRQHAVLVRAASAVAPLRRQLRRAGVQLAPVRRPQAFSNDPSCRVLLELLAGPDPSGLDDPNAAELQRDFAYSLVSSPLINLDSLSLFRFLRAADANVLPGADPEPATVRDLVWWLDHPDILQLDAVRKIDPETVSTLCRASRLWAARHTVGDALPRLGLWQLWRQADCAENWRSQALAGGWDADGADDRLDTVISLFRRADLWEQQQLELRPETVPTGRDFAREYLEQRIQLDSIAQGGLREPGVEVLTVSEAAGQQWERVYLVGLQDGAWPALGGPGGLLKAKWFTGIVTQLWNNQIPGGPLPVPTPGMEELTPVDAQAARMEQRRSELRLLLSALSRSSGSVEIHAVENEEEALSPFINYLQKAGCVPGPVPNEDGANEYPSAPLSDLNLQRFIGSLRFAAVDPDLDEVQTKDAALVLAYLAKNGIEGADPELWTGADSLTTDAAVTSLDRLRLKPSELQGATDCLLQWFFRAIGGQDARAPLGQLDMDPAEVGNLVHKLAEENPRAGAKQLQETLAQYWADNHLDDGTHWRQQLYEKIHDMLGVLGQYQAACGKDTEIRTEMKIDVAVGESRIAGRADRVEFSEPDTEGITHVRVIDIKTGSSVPTANELATHPQLLAYQLAFQGPAQAVSAALLTVGKPSRTGPLREQGTASAPEIEEFTSQLETLADRMVGPSYLPTVNGQVCRNCRFAAVCPAQPEGKRIFE